jgi:hypothetical protein
MSDNTFDPKHQDITDELNNLLHERDEARAHWGTESMNAAQFFGEKTKAIAERDEAREQNAKLRDIAEWAVDNIFHKCTEDLIRAELKELKQLK